MHSTLTNYNQNLTIIGMFSQYIGLINAGQPLAGQAGGNYRLPVAARASLM